MLLTGSTCIKAAALLIRYDCGTERHTIQAPIKRASGNAYFLQVINTGISEGRNVWRTLMDLISFDLLT